MIEPYYDGSDVITEDNGSSNYFKISPSSISSFFEYPRSWWGENFLNEPGFAGSTSTILGTIVHYFAECAANDIMPLLPQQVVENYLSTITFDCDKDEIRANWETMADVLLAGCVYNTKFHSTEKFIFHKVLPSIYVGGTYDAIVYNDVGELVLRDYKTSATKPSVFPNGYRMQLLTYAYILRSKGIDIKHIELCYITRATKTLPPRYFNFTEPLIGGSIVKIESQISTIAHSVELWSKQPELRWALAQDYRLHLPSSPKLFKLKD